MVQRTAYTKAYFMTQVPLYFSPRSKASVHNVRDVYPIGLGFLNTLHCGESTLTVYEHVTQILINMFWAISQLHSKHLKYCEIYLQFY